MFGVGSDVEMGVEPAGPGGRTQAMSDKPLLCVDYTPTRIFRGLDIPVSTITEGARDGVVRPAPRGGRGYGPDHSPHTSVVCGFFLSAI